MNASTPVSPERPPAELVEGDVIGGAFHIRSVIGQGGMGKIFEATDIVLQRRVAVKVPFTEEGSRALIQEAKALAALEDEHLPQIYGAGLHSGLQYIVMERLRGESLEDHLQQRIASDEPLGMRRALELLTTIAGALHSIHEAGIVHRDIKPDNVMLVPKRGPVLIDFGLVMPQSNPGDTEMTSGSPYYASPEMIDGSIGRTTGRQGDLYSFGVMAYELLTGRPPFHADDLRSLLAMHLQTPPPDVRLLRPDATPELAELILELMHKTPGQRPESAEEVVWRLQRILKQLHQRTAVQDNSVMIITQLDHLAGELQKCVSDTIRSADVRVFRDADSALSQLESAHPKLVFVDMKLEGMSGVELLMHAQSMDLTSTIVALVMDMRPEDMQVLRSMGVMCCLPIGQGMGASVVPILRNAFAESVG